MTISADAFKDVLRHFASGVTLLTVRVGERTHGMTVSAFVSVSADPPLVAVMVDRGAGAHDLLGEPGASFAINILGQEQQALSDRFAFEKEEDRFAAGSWETAETGAPVLREAVAWLDCRLAESHPAGSHTVCIGRVEASRVERPDALPLIYWNRGYRALEPA